MSFNSLAFKLFSVSSSLMGLSAPLQNIGGWASVEGNDLLTGNESFWETLWVVIRNSFGDLFIVLYETLITVFYAIGKWILTFIDFIFVIVRQLAGMNSDFDSVEEISQGDLIFKFVFSDSVVRIIRNVLIFSIVLLIIFSIFAIVKSEYQFVTQGGGNSKSKIYKSILRSLFLMFLVPVVCVGSIVMSNAILRSLYLITSDDNTSMSMGAQIFIASTYDANAYRRYANRDLKIPITYNFSEITENDNISGYYTDGSVAEMESALKEFSKQDVWTRGYKTFLMFASNGFLNMRDLDKLEIANQKNGTISTYHDVYDEGIYSRTEQYYIMADVIEYAMKTNTTIYFKTLEEVWESYYATTQHVAGEKPLGISQTAEGYAITVQYEGDSSSTTYTHKKGETDEAKGALYIMCVEKRVDSESENTTNQPYYYPIKNAIDNFSTDYYSGTQNCVIAKGLFDEGQYPTAIRQTEGKVEFYRDDINVPMLADLFPKISYEMPEGSIENLGTVILKGALSALTGVDISQFIPYVYFSIDIFNLFTKTTNCIVDLDNGELHLDYNFTSKDFDKKNVYKLADFNIVIFLLAGGILVSILLKIMFGLVFRTLDVVVLAITYPAVLSTLPLDDGARFKDWVNQFALKLLSMYAVVIGVNLVLLIVPILSEIDVFTKADIEFAIGAGELGATITADFLNMFVYFLFVLVAFASIQPFITSISELVMKGGTNKNGEASVVADGEMVVNELKKTAGRVGNFVSGKAFIEAGSKIMKDVTTFALPGSEIVNEVASDVVKGKKLIETKTKKLAGLNNSVNDVKSAAENSRGSNSGTPVAEQEAPTQEPSVNEAPKQNAENKQQDKTDEQKSTEKNKQSTSQSETPKQTSDTSGKEGSSESGAKETGKSSATSGSEGKGTNTENAKRPEEAVKFSETAEGIAGNISPTTALKGIKEATKEGPSAEFNTSVGEGGTAGKSNLTNENSRSNQADQTMDLDHSNNGVADEESETDEINNQLSDVDENDETFDSMDDEVSESEDNTKGIKQQDAVVNSSQQTTQNINANDGKNAEKSVQNKKLQANTKNAQPTGNFGNKFGQTLENLGIEGTVSIPVQGNPELYEISKVEQDGSNTKLYVSKKTESESAGKEKDDKSDTKPDSDNE